MGRVLSSVVLLTLLLCPRLVLAHAQFREFNAAPASGFVCPSGYYFAGFGIATTNGVYMYSDQRNAAEAAGAQAKPANVIHYGVELSYSYSAATGTATTIEGNVGSVNVYWFDSSENSGHFPPGVNLNATRTIRYGCTKTPPCPSAGKEYGMIVKSPELSNVSTFCDVATGGCAVQAEFGLMFNRQGGAGTFSRYVYGGGRCNVTNTTPQPPTAVDPSKCEFTNGVTVCRSPYPNCMQVNGRSVCTSSAGGVCDTDECINSATQVLHLPDGTEIYRDDAPPEIKPNDGTYGVPTEPDAVFGGQGGFSTTNTYEAYSSSTVSGSVPNPDPEAPDGETDSGTGTCSTPPCEDGEGGSFSGPGGGWPELSEAPTFGESVSSMVDGITATGLGQAMTEAGQNIPEGDLSCLPPSFEIWGQTFTFDLMCDLFVSYGDLLRAFAVLAWAMLAVRTFMEA